MPKIEVNYIDHCGSDLTTVNAARVSFGKQSGWENEDEVWVSPYIGEVRHEMMSPWVTPVLSGRDTKLIRYLAKHKHISPFGHAFASFHIKAPIFVARQLVKHKFLRWNEISRRYVYSDVEFYVPDQWRGRSADKKQGSEGVVYPTADVAFNNYTALRTYNELLDVGVSPEQARTVLPQSIMTEWYWSGSLDAFAAMCRLRCASDTQYESRLVADQISEEMADLFPVSWDALMGNS